MLFEVLVFIAMGGMILLGYVSWKQGHWRRVGMPTLHSTFILGSLGDAVLKKKATSNVIKDLYLEAVGKGLKYGGIYISTSPSLLLADPELIRIISVKYFDHFTDRRRFSQKGIDELLNRSLLNLEGDEWRHMRHSLSPAFTGSKLRSMMGLMTHTGRQFVKFFTTRNNPEEALDMREAFRRFAADVIATTAFGTISDSVNNPESEFYKNGKELLNFNGIRKFIVLGYFIAPKLMQFLKIKFMPESLNKYFINTVVENIKYREVQKMSRPDMIQLLIEERKNQTDNNENDQTQYTLSDLDIVSQAFTFFLGGFETVATAMSYAALALAAHPEIQDRLRAEVDVAFYQGGGTITYEAVQNLKYMDMVLSEVLRMYPVVPIADRTCTKPIHIPEFNLSMKIGDAIVMPYFGFHYNPEFFPEPENFDPERFNEANKHNIKPFTYLPFGTGPRNCIGMRFAQLEVKLVLAYLLASSELRCSASTQLPIRLDPKRIDNTPEGGFMVIVTPREEPSTET